MPSEVPLREIRKRLEEHGWTLERISGSHDIFVKAGERPIRVTVHRPRVKHVYLREIRKKVGEGPAT